MEVDWKNMILERECRIDFDALQSYQEGVLGAVEGQTTQLAEKVGYKLGSANYAEKHPILNFFRYEEDDLPAH